MIRTYKELMKKQSGFTVVELLIVIVVIGILATLTIVSYSGVTSDANTVKAQSNAQNVQKVAEAYNAENGYYPQTAAALQAGGTATQVPSGITVEPDAATPAVDSSNGTTTVAYACSSSCTTPSGVRLAYYDFSGSSVGYIYLGDAASGDTFVYPGS